MERKAFMLVLLFPLLLGCNSREPNSAAYIQELLEERVSLLVDRITRDCQSGILEAATNQADSLLIERARRMRRIEGRPPRPPKPGSPPVKELSSPLPLRPLFPFEIRFDTLLRDSLFQDSIRVDSLMRLELEQEG